MYEKIEFNQLVKGERYFVRYGRYNKWISGKLFKLENTERDGIHAIFSSLKKNIGSGWRYKGIKWRMDSNDLYYKHVPNKEYLQKIKDKYDEKVLKIVLKKIVNEDFEWI
jgi:hypothetical protein